MSSGASSGTADMQERIDRLERMVYILWSLIDRIDDRSPFLGMTERIKIQNKMLDMVLEAPE